MKKKGLIQVYTGNGKGKTTAAIGLACRAVGHNLKVCYISFHKNPKTWGYGEHNSLQKLEIDCFGFSKGRPNLYKTSSRQTDSYENIRKKCLEGLEFIKTLFTKNIYDIIILDEIFISIKNDFLKEKEVLDILDTKPEKLELVLTGRNATKAIIEKADLVSEIKKIKHPYDLKIRRRKGIEY